jgi:hypothetical protein
VVQWSDEGDNAVTSLDALREKAKSDVSDKKLPFKKKRIRGFEDSVEEAGGAGGGD